MLAEIAGSKATNIERPSGIPNLFVVENAALESILFNRNVIGLDFRDSCLSASRFFVGHLADELEENEYSELVILGKGLVYQVAEAFARELGRNTPTNLIATYRVTASAESAKIEIPYARFDAPSPTLVIGDTVASGATIIAALDEYRRVETLKRVYLVSYAGSLVGARRISSYCVERSISLTVLYGLAAFGLADNGFDLAFLHRDTIASDEYKDRARQQFSGKAVSAVGWDFGSQTTAPEKYRKLCWVEADVWGLHGTSSLQLEQRPDHWSEVAREAAAYSDELSSPPNSY